MITCDWPDGEHGAVVDFVAISAMIALDAVPTTARPATVTSARSGQVTTDRASGTERIAAELHGR